VLVASATVANRQSVSVIKAQKMLDVRIEFLATYALKNVKKRWFVFHVAVKVGRAMLNLVFNGLRSSRLDNFSEEKLLLK
jgi:hypothetical protein